MTDYAISTRPIVWAAAKGGVFGWPTDGPEAYVAEVEHEVVAGARVVLGELARVDVGMGSRSDRGDVDVPVAGPSTRKSQRPSSSGHGLAVGEDHQV